MDGRNHRPSRFNHPQQQPTQQPPHPPHPPPQHYVDPNLLLNNLGAYLQNSHPFSSFPFNPYFQNPNTNFPLPHNPTFYPSAFPNSSPQTPTASSSNPDHIIHINPTPDPTSSNSNSSLKRQRPTNTKFPFQRKAAANVGDDGRREMLEKIEVAIATARSNYIASGEYVSALKVSQFVLLNLCADSWESLGFQLQEVPSMRTLIFTEGKINAFINCYVAVHRITSLFDLEMAICKNEGIEKFEELELGPFLCQPLVVHYFSLSKDVKGVYKITGEEVVSYLSEFFDARRRKKVKIEEFLDFIAKKCQVTSWEKLGVRIQSLGMHIAFLREAYTSNGLVMKKCLETMKERSARSSTRKPLLAFQKKQLDDRFSAITERVSSFASVNKDSCGQHLRFDSSSSGDDDDDAMDSCDTEGDTSVMSMQCQLSSQKGKSGDRVSGCPYPSVTEERTRLGLRGEKNECSSPSALNLKCNQIMEPPQKKRKLKSQKQGETKELSSFPSPRGTKTKRAKYLPLGGGCDSIGVFIMTWKETCRQHSAAEVFEIMVQSYKMSRQQQRKLRSASSTYPLLGLLNVAVTSIKNGMWDSMYDSFQSMGNFGRANKHAEESENYEKIDVEPMQKIPCLNEDILKHDLSVNTEDIVSKVSEYLAENATFSDGCSPLHRVLMFAKQLCRCEVWLVQQFSVEEFKVLGHGDFLSFIETHAAVIPKELLDFVGSRVQETKRLEARMPEQQLVMLLSQASSSLWEDGGVTKEKVSELLRMQFPSVSLKIVGSGVDGYLDSLRLHKNNVMSNCVVFSSTLLGTSGYDVTYSKESSLSNNSGLVADAGPINKNLESVTSRDAIELLLKAPFLSDLISWSHWDIVYAPSLGPLLEWLLTEVNVEGLLCVLTRDGKVIRIDHLASEELFFQALLQESPFRAAVQLLSLFVLCGGKRHVPFSFLKSQAHKAFEVIFENFTKNLDINDNQRTKEAFKEVRFCQAVGHFSSIGLSKSSKGMNGAVKIVSRIVIECLYSLPPEFRFFAADILISGLQSVVKDVASATLLNCNGTEERLMLHEIGFSLGVVEWIQDHKSCCPITGNNSMVSSYSSSFIPGDSDVERLEFLHSPVDSISATAACQDDQCYIDAALSNTLGSSVVGSGRVISHHLPDKETDQQREAACIVESIRREEFGLDPNISDVESSMLKKQHARLGRALHCLSQELYSQDSHFLLELVQNADDNVYPKNVEPTLIFILQHTGIVVLNNERGFTGQNIKALCDVGNSTKKGSSAGYIGQKGIGFKSVFRVTDAPEIHSNGFNIKFDISEGQIGFVLPSIVSPCNIEMLEQLAYEDDSPRGLKSWNTCIVLPFKSKLVEGSSMNSIVSMFSDLHPSLLLFLHRLQCIKLRNMLSDSLIVMRKEIVGDGIVKVSHGKEKMTWFVAANKLHPKVFRPNVQMTKISIALTLKETGNGDYEAYLDQQPVFAFLPLRTYGLKFILQADFILPSSREEVDGNSPWNQWLLSEFPGLFVSAEKLFCSLPCFKLNPAKAVTTYMGFVPLMGEVHGFFSGLPRMIISKLRQSNCLLEDGCKGKWVPPCKVLRGWSEQAQRLLPDSLLHEHLGIGFLHRDILLSDALTRALGVEEYGPRILIKFISSLSYIKDGVKSMGLNWLLSWLNELYNMFHSYGSNLRNSESDQELLDGLKKVPFIPLSDGTYGSLDDGTIWFHADSTTAGIDEGGNEAFPYLYATLRMVNNALFSEASSDVALANNCARMLQRIGVQRLSAHELIRIHILRSISDKVLGEKDQQLMTEYLAFVMLHLQSNCVECQVESELIISELRSSAIILTNYGYKRPIDVSLHFSTEFGNSVDANKFIQALDYKWHEVNSVYLNHPVTKLVSCGLNKWREFLQKLDVTDFVKVIMVEKSIADLSPTVLNQLICDGKFMSSELVVKDWESPELPNILSLLSKYGCQDRCQYLLEVLDTLWDDHFSDKIFGSCCNQLGTDSISFKSSLMHCISDNKWIVSSADNELHYPKELFHDCDAVRCVLGSLAPYAVPKIRSSRLLSEIGFRTQVTLDDALIALSSWKKSESPFTTSLSQMSKLYSFIWKEMGKSRQQVLDSFNSGPFIFVPCDSVKGHEDVVNGVFLPPGEVYWYDSTGAMDCSKGDTISVKTTNDTFSKTLCTMYPGLHDFFVIECGVDEAPPLRDCIQILRQLSRSTLPREAANAVFQVLVRWSDGMTSGALSSDDMSYLKECLSQTEFAVLPTLQDKWVSLHSSFGLLCWCDDDMLKKEFKHSDNIEVLYFGELNNIEKEILQGNVSVFLQNLGIPALSEVVSREAIYYGSADCGLKTSLVGWVLPFAQRYIYNLHPEKYTLLKTSGFSKLDHLKIVVVEKLFYRNVITRCGSASRKRSECSSLLQGNILYATQESDSHSMFVELSRLFFDGAPELHLANFLHMITTMVESGSTEEQIEFFILNCQKMTKLPDDESVWSMATPAPLTDNNEVVPADAFLNNINKEPMSVKSQKKPGCWPPADWKTAPGFKYSRENGFRSQAVVTDKSLNSQKKDHLSEDIIQEKDDVMFTEINEDTFFEDNGVVDPDSALFPVFESQPAGGVYHEPHSSLDPLNYPTDITVDSICPEENQSKSSGRDQLLSSAPGAQQAMLVGRLGEQVAFKYFSEKYGGQMVNWINQDTETGLPYDIVVGKDDVETTKEYFEVKASRYARKDWFVISTREWQFAAEKGDSFSIAYVILSGQNLARITIYKNPVKLCQLGKLQLAVMTPKLYQEPIP